MNRLVDRKFRLVLDADINVWVGANKGVPGPGATRQVVTHGGMKTWTFERGYLILDGVWFSIQDGENVVVRVGVNEGTAWDFNLPEPEVVQIGTPDLKLLWTVNSANPNEPVTLQPPSKELAVFQLFRFDPIS